MICRYALNAANGRGTRYEVNRFGPFRSVGCTRTHISRRCGCASRAHCYARDYSRRRIQERADRISYVRSDCLSRLANRGARLRRRPPAASLPPSRVAYCRKHGASREDVTVRISATTVCTENHFRRNSSAHVRSKVGAPPLIRKSRNVILSYKYVRSRRRLSVSDVVHESDGINPRDAILSSVCAEILSRFA